MTRPAVMYAAAFLAALGATALLTPVAGGLAKRVGLLDRPAPNKHHRSPTPYLGGLAVVAGLALAAVPALAPPGREPVQRLAVTLACALALAAVGLVDDWRGLGPLLRVTAQSAAAALLWGAGVRGGLFGVPALDLLLTVAWVVGVTNALNLLDNMDGLAAGVTGLAGLGYFAIAAMHGSYLVASFAAGLAGASAGFLLHNFPPARIFLGDAGSLPLGFLLAALGLELNLMAAEPVRAAIPALIVAVPAFDTALVVVSRVREGRPWYRGNTDHASHRLARAGLSPRQVALCTYGVQAGLTGTAVALARARPEVVALTALGVGALLVAGLALLLRVPWRGGGPLAVAEGEPDRAAEGAHAPAPCEPVDRGPPTP